MVGLHLEFSNNLYKITLCVYEFNIYSTLSLSSMVRSCYIPFLDKRKQILGTPLTCPNYSVMDSGTES